MPARALSMMNMCVLVHARTRKHAPLNKAFASSHSIDVSHDGRSVAHTPWYSPIACFNLHCRPICCQICSDLRTRASARATPAFCGCQLLRTTLIAAMISAATTIAIATSMATLAYEKARIALSGGLVSTYKAATHAP
eukprot:6179319-Pleurochrysis_carterae.AAC.2